MDGFASRGLFVAQSSLRRARGQLDKLRVRRMHAGGGESVREKTLLFYATLSLRKCSVALYVDNVLCAFL